MIHAYADSSVILRAVLGEPKKYKGLTRVQHLYSSELLRIESLRAIDRLRIRNAWPNKEVALRIHLLSEFCLSLHEVPLQPSILQRASEPFPTLVKTLDALHVATALLTQKQLNKPLLFLTHDQQQGEAAIAVGLAAEGWIFEAGFK